MELSVPVMLGALVFVWSAWAVLFWGSIALVERHNPYNTFGWALVWAAADVAVSIFINHMNFAGIGLLLAWLVFLMRLLLGRYELSFLHALGVVIVMVVGPYFVADGFVAFVGESETLFLVALYGFPATVFVVWRWPRPHRGAPTNLPEARATKARRKRGATATEEAAVEAAAPAPMTAAPAAPMIAAPAAPITAAAAAPRAPIAAPPVAPRADGEPSVLR